MKKIVNLILIVFIIISCSNDDCKNKDEVTFILNNPILLKSTDGQNLFYDINFDISLLKIFSHTDPTKEVFFQTSELDRETVIIMESPPNNGVVFSYNQENKTDLSITNLETEEDSCGTITSYNFTVISEGRIICECNLQDVINIQFDI